MESLWLTLLLLRARRTRGCFLARCRETSIMHRGLPERRGRRDGSAVVLDGEDQTDWASVTLSMALRRLKGASLKRNGSWGRRRAGR